MMNLVEWASAKAAGFTIVLRQHPRDTLVEEEGIFMRAFTKAYQDLDVVKDLHLTVDDGSTPAETLEKFLREAFAEEKKRFASATKDSGEIFYAAVSKVSRKAIGYIGVCKAKDSIYLAQLAVEPACGGSGIGRALAFCAADDTTERIHLLTRRTNVGAIGFYNKLGFKETERREPGHEDLDPKLYVAMEWLKKDQAGVSTTKKSPVSKLV